ncbi:hypothetical protein [Rubritalea tangerina]|uniref:Uncharacterized protein n=1 Tax=Rubritalea tangerina TaxID=430798 RepID=A0ABW4Z760_9BACT
MKKRFTWLVSCLAVMSLQLTAVAAEVPEYFAKAFEKDKPVKAQIIAIIPPKEFEGFVQKLSEAAQKDPEWFDEHSKKTAGSPLPLYDEKLGMSQEEYDKYAKLWDSREAKKLADTSLLLEEVGNGQWKINATGPAASISLLRYDPEKNVFTSTNGEMIAIADIDAPERSLLGAWKGKEWRYQSENSLTKMKENLALGTTTDGKYAILVYRLQEITAKGKPLFDQSLVIRFPAIKSK